MHAKQYFLKIENQIYNEILYQCKAFPDFKTGGLVPNTKSTPSKPKDKKENPSETPHQIIARIGIVDYINQKDLEKPIKL